jgi:DNA-binding MarR family transcriptional regulator
MGETLRHRLRQERFRSPQQEAILNVLVAAAHVRDRTDRAFAERGLTGPQYNVLRILRGAEPDGLARVEIGRRMIARAPDLTRLIDRLARRSLVERSRSERDRRQSRARITRKGLQLLADLEPGVIEVERGMGQRLSSGEARTLSRLCEKLYQETDGD